MPTATKTGINTPAIVAAREAYAARFKTLSDAIEFENHVLGIGREFLPDCALAVIDERADVDAPSAETVEYYEWLLEQANEAHDAADGDESEDDGKLTLDAATVDAISTGKTVVDAPAGEVLAESMPCTMWSPRLQHQPATEWLKLRCEDVTASEIGTRDDAKMVGNGTALAGALQHSLQARAIGGLAQAAMSSAEDASLLSAVESAYEAAKGTWTGRSWDDGDKITPESTDDQIADMMTREEDIKVTCWGVDESVNSWHSRVRAAVSDLTAMWNRDDLGERFYETMNTLRELAEESDAGVAERARVAETDAAEAIKEARSGNKHSALVHAEHAAKVEREFGDAPTWGPFCEAVRAFYEHDAG